jgi:uncharacterized protein
VLVGRAVSDPTFLASDMRPRIFLPGWGGSGAGHWQTLWQARMRGSRRAEMPDWLVPARQAWVQAIDRTVAATIASSGQAPVLIAHSLGCIALAWWATLHTRAVSAAMLVAPPAIEGEDVAMALREFAPTPSARLPFRSLVVASTNDPYASAEHSATLARQWGSELVVLSEVGHINIASGHGEWPEGLTLLRQLVAS